MDKSAFGLRGVGKQIEKYLARLDIYSVRDLLLHLPARYQDRTQVLPMRGLPIGQEAVVEGVITNVALPAKTKTKLLVQLKDHTGKMSLRFFHTMPYAKDSFKVGVMLRCYGDVRLGPQGLEMTHPEFRVIREDKPIPVDSHLTPVYPAGEGLTQYTLRNLTTNALQQIDNYFQELLPPTILNEHAWPNIKEAIQFLHRPPRTTPMLALQDNSTPAQKRLVFEELLAHRITLLNIKRMFKARSAIPLNETSTIQKFLDQLPFQLTNAQQRVVAEVQADLKKDQPMLRLVQGDVGSGKTIVAAIAMLQANASGHQAVLMAPTELLAEQHYRNFQKWFATMGVKIAYLSGKVKAKERREAITAIADGTANIVIGTHAVFQEKVQFQKLALVVVDEQHRFGVEQRADLQEKGQNNNCYPHQLVMTATPIPRTLAMSFYADLDCSVIDELPPGRTPIVTSVIANSRRDEVIARIREACQSGKQAYWVCPLIEESEHLSAQAATTAYEDLKLALKDLKIGLIHGRMKSDAKDKEMQAFQRGETHLLVATTVIEVGVDVPNASLMIIENAERLGLSQLHQLRGRVGRGKVASHCLLLYQNPLSEVGKQRLQVMRETNDGFKIAQFDLELRGPGEVLGTKQTGAQTFILADLLRDSALLPQVQRAAEIILNEYNQIVEPLVKRWIYQAQEFSNV